MDFAYSVELPNSSPVKIATINIPYTRSAAEYSPYASGADPGATSKRYPFTKVCLPMPLFWTWYCEQLSRGGRG
jgi:hypothetical protein